MESNGWDKFWNKLYDIWHDWVLPGLTILLMLGLLAMCGFAIESSDREYRQEQKDFKSECISKNGTIQESQSGKLSCLYK